MHHTPGLFDEIIAMFIFWGGAEKIIYSDGTSSVIHNRSGEFWNLQPVRELLHKYGIKQISKADKALILGGNYARANRLNVEI